MGAHICGFCNRVPCQCKKDTSTLEDRIMSLEDCIKTQTKLNSSLLDTLKIQSNTIEKMIELYQALEVKINMLNSFKNERFMN